MPIPGSIRFQRVEAHPAQSSQGSIRCRQVLGGIIQDYYREAA